MSFKLNIKDLGSCKGDTDEEDEEAVEQQRQQSLQGEDNTDCLFRRYLKYPFGLYGWID